MPPPLPPRPPAGPRRPPPVRRHHPAHRARHPAHHRGRLRLPRLRQRVRRGADLDLHARRHPGHGPRRAVPLVRAEAALQRPGDPRGVQPPGRRVRHRPPQPSRGREAARRPGGRPRPPGTGDGPGLHGRREPLPRRRSARRESPTPPATGPPTWRERAHPIDVWYGVYLANLLASSGVFVKEIVDADPPAPGRPGHPEPGRERGRPRQAAGRPRQGPEHAVRLQRHGRRRRRQHHRQGDAARQPALPVARPLPLHPAAAHDPRDGTTSPGRR